MHTCGYGFKMGVKIVWEYLRWKVQRLLYLLNGGLPWAAHIFHVDTLASVLLLLDF